MIKGCIQKIFVASVLLIHIPLYSLEWLRICFSKRRQSVVISEDQQCLKEIRFLSEKAKAEELERSATRCYRDLLCNAVERLSSDARFKEFLKIHYGGVLCEQSGNHDIEDRLAQEKALANALPSLAQPLVQIIGDYSQRWQKAKIEDCYPKPGGGSFDAACLTLLDDQGGRHLLIDSKHRGALTRYREPMKTVILMEPEKLRELWLLREINRSDRPQDPVEVKIENEKLERLVEEGTISRDAAELTKKRHFVVVPVIDID